MTAIEQHIEATRKAINLELDQLLERVRGNAAFLAEMNATNDHEPQAEYGVSMLVEAPPSIPDLEGVEPRNLRPNLTTSRRIKKFWLKSSD